MSTWWTCDRCSPTSAWLLATHSATRLRLPPDTAGTVTEEWVTKLPSAISVTSDTQVAWSSSTRPACRTRQDKLEAGMEALLEHHKNGMLFELLAWEAVRDHEYAVHQLITGDNLDAAFALRHTDIAFLEASWSITKVLRPTEIPGWYWSGTSGGSERARHPALDSTLAGP